MHWQIIPRTHALSVGRIDWRENTTRALNRVRDTRRECKRACPQPPLKRERRDIAAEAQF